MSLYEVLQSKTCACDDEDNNTVRHFTEQSLGVGRIYLEEDEGVGDAELHLLSVHSWRIVSVELHQILRLVDGAQLHKRLQSFTTHSFLTTKHACVTLHFTEHI